MALNQSEKELLAVVRYFNQEVENKHVARLVAKLSKDFNPADVKALTGFGENEINVLIKSIEPKRRRKNYEPDGVLTDQSGHTFIMDHKETSKAEPKPKNRRLAIHLNAESGITQRVAYDIAKAIESELKPGDIFWSGKEILNRFEITERTRGLATKILRSHNWIEEVEPGNFRKGYVVK